MSHFRQLNSRRCCAHDIPSLQHISNAAFSLWQRTVCTLLLTWKLCYCLLPLLPTMLLLFIQHFGSPTSPRHPPKSEHKRQTLMFYILTFTYNLFNTSWLIEIKFLSQSHGQSPGRLYGAKLKALVPTLVEWTSKCRAVVVNLPVQAENLPLRTTPPHWNLSDGYLNNLGKKTKTMLCAWLNTFRCNFG